MHKTWCNLLGRVVATGMLMWLPAGCVWRPLEPIAATVESAPAATQVVVVRSADRTVLEVHSPSGIGRSRVTFAEALPSGPLEFRLHLRGLEHFELAYGSTRLTVSLPQGGVGLLVMLQPANQPETAVVPGSSYWMEVEPPTPGSGDPVIRVVAPLDLSAQRPRVIEFGWIDFYR